MSDWIALSDRADPLEPDTPALLQQGALVMEMSLPLEVPCVLLDFRVTGTEPRALSVFHDPKMGVAILHRQGERLVRHMLPGPLPRDIGIARLILRWDAPAGTWGLRYELPESGIFVDSRGVNPLPLPLADLLALCGGRGITQRHPALLWFGATRGANPPERAPWLGLRTPVATVMGYCPAGALKAGDVVLTADGGARAVQSVRRMNLPSRGFFSPVLLRSPYFADRTDLLVSADQLIALSGPEVEYLFAEDEVLAEARHLTDGWSALFDDRRAVTACVSIDLGCSDLIQSDGCILASHHHGPLATRPPLLRRQLHSYEAVPLLALLGRGNGRRAA